MQAPAGRWQCRAWLFEYSVGAQDESYRPVQYCRNSTVPGSQQVKSIHKQQTTIRKPIECAPEASSGGREWAEMTGGLT